MGRFLIPGPAASLAVALLATGCSGAGASASAGAATDMSPDPRALDLAAGGPTPDLAGALAGLDGAGADLWSAYPAGPYGSDVGSVAPNFSWQGFFDVNGVWPATSLPFGEVSFQRLRLTGARYLFVYTGGFW